MEKELHTNESNNIDIHSTSLERKLSLALHKRYPDNLMPHQRHSRTFSERVHDASPCLESA